MGAAQAAAAMLRALQPGCRMSAFASTGRRSRWPLIVGLLLIVAAALGAGGWFLAPRMESQPPRIVLPEVEFAGTAPVEIAVSDAGTGLKSVSVTLVQGSSEQSLANDQFAQPVADRKYLFALAKLPGVREGAVKLRVVARDSALRANETVVEKTVTLDLTPPALALVADDRYVNFGGAGVLVYTTSADAATSGVRLGERFFPGFAGHIKGHPERLLVFFAHPYDAPAEARPVLVATDRAGNTRELPVAYELKNVRYRKSTIALSDSFVQNKVAPLLADATARQGSIKEVFVRVNKDLRRDNEAKIAAITSKATPQLLWSGAFTQLPNSKVEANFADLRTYTYNGEPVDTAYHVGYDLSVTRAYPVEAANRGTVVYAGDLGIYGGTVILDHGLGLFTLYSHLSAIDAKEGATVEPRAIIGKTGETGLAGGDHLHYGVYLHGVAVLPVEWWDGKWIADNITPKLEGGSGQEIAEAQQAAKPKAKGKAKAGKRKR